MVLFRFCFDIFSQRVLRFVQKSDPRIVRFADLTRIRRIRHKPNKRWIESSNTSEITDPKPSSILRLSLNSHKLSL